MSGGSGRLSVLAVFAAGLVIAPSALVAAGKRLTVRRDAWNALGALACALLLMSVGASSAYASTGFGIERYGLTATNEDGSADAQAGSHPYEVTAEAGLESGAQSASEVRDLNFELPLGLTLDPSAVPPCTYREFTGGTCPNEAAVGVVRISVAGITVPAAVYNLVPAPGEPAELGFTLKDTPVIVDVAVRTGGDYGMTVSVPNIPRDEVESVKLVLWGVPSEAGHDALRGSCATGGGTCPSEAPLEVFLTLPTACAGDDYQVSTGGLTFQTNPSHPAKRSTAPHSGQSRR